LRREALAHKFSSLWIEHLKMWRTAVRRYASLGLAGGGGLMACQCQADDAALATTFPLGLTGAGATHRFYTQSLDLAAPLLQRGSGDFMAAARADARERLGLGAEGSTLPLSAAQRSAAQRSGGQRAAAHCQRLCSMQRLFAQ
jgi:hypothetical protein